MSDARTLSVYNSRGPDYAQRADEYAAADPNVARFLGQLTPGDRVLDLGCGSGSYALRFSRAGMHVEAWDASEALIAMMAAHPNITPHVARFEALDADALYAGVWAHFSLLHAPRAAFPRHLHAVHRALRPGGVLFLGMKLGTGGKRDEMDRYFEYYTIAELHAALETAGFTPEADWEVNANGLDGLSDTSVVIQARA